MFPNKNKKQNKTPAQENKVRKKNYVYNRQIFEASARTLEKAISIIEKKIGKASWRAIYPRTSGEYDLGTVEPSKDIFNEEETEDCAEIIFYANHDDETDPDWTCCFGKSHKDPCGNVVVRLGKESLCSISVCEHNVVKD